jgi:hypothetical protein
MLISMPTGTSTIFGAFQAITLSLLEQGRIPPSRYKVIRTEKFASKILCARQSVACCSAKEFDPT